MITALRGALEAVGPGWAVVQVGGVSLKVNVPLNTLSSLGPPGGVVRLHTHLVVREDDLSLYGFLTPEALRLFELLLTVAGVGPRVALGILSGASPEAIAQAILTEDLETLARLPGVGMKRAHRLALELKGKLEQEWAGAAPAPGSEGEVLAALAALGYSTTEARQAVASAGLKPGAPLEEKVMRALQRLGQGA